MRQKASILAVLLLSIAGSILAAYLNYEHLFGTGQCHSGGNCGDVLSSEYSTFAGIPIAAFGLGLCAALTYCAWRSLFPLGKSGRYDILLAVSIVGVLPIPYLIYLQAAVIQSWCIYCLSLSGILITNFLLLVINRESAGRHALKSYETIAILALLAIPPSSMKLLKTGIETKLHPRGENPIIATIDERDIHLNELKKAVQLELYTKENELRITWLEQQILETAAKNIGLTLDQYVIQKVYASIEVSDSEVQAFYEQVKHDIPGGEATDNILQNIKNQIGKMKGKDAISQHIEMLKERFEYSYSPPISERLLIGSDFGDAPSYGSEMAPITLVVFSDFNCSHCARAHSELVDKVDEYPGQVRLVYKNFPVYSEQNGEAAAKVAACARFQNKFWEVAELLFEREFESFDDSILVIIAEETDLDLTLLRQHMSDGSAEEVVRTDIEEGRGLGLYATPSMFVNGRYVGYLQPQELEQFIMTELEIAE